MEKCTQSLYGRNRFRNIFSNLASREGEVEAVCSHGRDLRGVEMMKRNDCIGNNNKLSIEHVCSIKTNRKRFGSVELGGRIV